MLDLALAYTRYRFLGNEFLTWLWYVIDNEKYGGAGQDGSEAPFSLHVGNRLVLENRQNEGLETITIKGDDAGLEEGLLALRKGALVSEINLKCTRGSQQWTFTLKGESLNLSNLKFPDPTVVETRQDLEASVLDRIFMTEKIVDLIEGLYARFVKQRLSTRWDNSLAAEIRKWVHAEG